MSDRIERLLLAAQEDIDTLGSELEIAERERDRYRVALETVLALRSSFDLEHYGRDVPLVGNRQAREIIERALKP